MRSNLPDLEDRLRVLRGLRLPEKMAYLEGVRKQKNHGQPPLTEMERAAAFISKIKIDGNGCWVWTAAAHCSGYGVLWFLGKLIYAHRLAWRFAFGAAPPDMMVCHHCDNPPCCNPSHLFIGTAMDNVSDCISKGRARKAVGEKASRSKLTRGKVLMIRKLFKAGNGTYTTLGKDFKVSSNSIKGIVTKKYWTHI